MASEDERVLHQLNSVCYFYDATIEIMAIPCRVLYWVWEAHALQLLILSATWRCY